MNMLLIIMSITATLCIVGLAAYFGWILYQKRRGADDPGMDVSYLRPPPIINTFEYGPVVPEHFEFETNTSGHATVHDTNGRLRTLSPVLAEELHVRNMLQVVFGSGPAEFDWIPKAHAEREQRRYAERAGALIDAVNYKHKFDMAQTDAIVEKENSTLELDKTVERLQAINKANPAVGKK